MAISEDAGNLKWSLFIQSIIILEAVVCPLFLFVSGFSHWVDSSWLLGYLKLWFANELQVLECEYFYVCERENICIVLCNDRQSYKGHNYSSWNNWLSWISCSERVALDIFSTLCYVDIPGRTWKWRPKDFYYSLVEIYERFHSF